MTGREKTHIWTLRLLMILAGAAFVIIGVCRHEHLEIMAKAVKICLDCIGIG